MRSKSRKRKPKPDLATIEALPTPERFQHSGGAFEIGGDARSRRVVRMVDSPIDRALQRRAITRRQHEAAAKFQVHWYQSGLAGNLQSVDLDRALGGSDGAALMPRSENEAFHRMMYRGAVQSLGMLDTGLIERIVCAEQSFEAAGRWLGWGHKGNSIAAATERLRAALDVLVRLWKL